MSLKKVAVVYATKGGMGDAGKFAAAWAARDTTIEARIVSLSRDEAEGGGHGIDGEEIDVKDPAMRADVAKDLEGENIVHADVDDSDMTMNALEEAFHGADAVVACVGARQGTFGVWVAQAAQYIIDAMKKKGVERLVILSSMGINDDYVPLGFIRVLWRTMLGTVLRATRNDLYKMEEIVSNSQLNYLLVRPMGLSPDEASKEKNSWKILSSKSDGPIHHSIAKIDVGRFMLDEAVEPSHIRTAVTLGTQPK